ncbi:hypothetical protein N7463_002633 [Penicillium fimorum]|uniref:Uncharacterized protein n=1 Tax=Penicillium fimorum TaxID=1882269 RepID=A0A9X0C8N9_9EURO|nr:hypothetical protein N7463_002633 [Penicillium fimorum]
MASFSASTNPFDPRFQQSESRQCNLSALQRVTVVRSSKDLKIDKINQERVRGRSGVGGALRLNLERQKRGSWHFYQKSRLDV